MQLLLTSNGLDDPGVVAGLAQMWGRNFCQMNVAFVPTANTRQAEDKRWLIDDLYRFRGLSPASIDIVELLALPREQALQRLGSADVIVCGGGDAYHLREAIDRLDLSNELCELLHERLYVGISAGSILTNPTLGISSTSTLWGEIGGSADPSVPGLGLVPFYTRPHLHSRWFATSQPEALRQVTPRLDHPIYAIADGAALMVVDDEVTPVGSGPVIVYPEGNDMTAVSSP